VRDSASCPSTPLVTVNETTGPPPAKRSKSFACYETDVDVQQTAPTTAAAQMTSYLNLCAPQQTPDSCLTFWSQHERDLNKLHQLAMSVLSVPATSAAVERVFSHGGLFMRPQRARMSDKLLSSLVFLKCNM